MGELNILVNNAGVYEFAPLEGITEENFHRHFNLNVLGLLLATKKAVKLIGPEGGSIINIGSGVSTINPPNSAVDTGTKAAMDSHHRSTGQRTRTSQNPRQHHQPRLNPYRRRHHAEKTKTNSASGSKRASPLGRMGQADDIAPTAVYLASCDSKYLTGETLRVTGGIF